VAGALVRLPVNHAAVHTDSLARITMSLGRALLSAGEWDLIASGEPRALGSLRSGGRAEPQSAPSRGPHLTARAVRFADLDGVLVPVSCARLERTAGLDHQRVGRQNPEPPVHPALRRMPGVRSVLSSVPTAVRTVPPASRSAREAL
jgi:hypothetical protein